MGRLRREFKTLAKADITGRPPNVKAELMPCIANVKITPIKLFTNYGYCLAKWKTR